MHERTIVLLQHTTWIEIALAGSVVMPIAWVASHLRPSQSSAVLDALIGPLICLWVINSYRARPWLAVWTSCSQFVAVFIGLRYQVKGVSVVLLSAWSWSLVAQHLSVKHEHLPGLVNIGLHSILVPASMLLLPRVYPEISYPWWTLPLMVGGVGIALSFGRQDQSQVTPSNTFNSAGKAVREPGVVSLDCVNTAEAVPQPAACLLTGSGTVQQAACLQSVQSPVDIVTMLQQEMQEYARSKRQYLSKTSTFTVRCKIPHMEPSQLPPDFLQLLNNSLSKDPRHPCLIMNASMRTGCIELVLDVALLDTFKAPVTTPATPAHPNHVLHITGMAGRIVQPISAVLDPTTWLQHLHMQPPRGVVATAQICGRHWETAWEDEIQSWAVKLRDAPPPEVQPPVILDDHFVVLLPPASPVFESGVGQELCPCAHNPPGWDPAQAQQLRITVRNARNRTDFRVTSQGQCLPAQAVLVDDLSSHNAEVDIATFDVCFFVPELTSVMMVECCVDKLVGNRVPILVTRDGLLAGDIIKLLTSADPADSDVTYTVTPSSRSHLLEDLGSWLKYIAGLAGASATKQLWAAAAEPDKAISFSLSSQMQGLQISGLAHRHMADIGLSLLDMAIGTGCVHLAQLVMQGLLLAGHSYAWVSSQCAPESCEHTYSTNSCLLHFAVISRSTDMVDLVLRWEAEHLSTGVWLSQKSVSSGGVTSCFTALHVAAALDDGGKIARHLLVKFPEARGGWDVPAAWGYSPQGLFVAAGHIQMDLSKACLVQASAVPSAVIVGSAHELSSSMEKAPLSSMEAAAVQRAGDDYHTWLSRRDIVISKQLSVIAICLAGVVMFGIFCEGEVPAASPMMLMMMFHMMRLALILHASETYVKRRELLNICWHCTRVLLKISPLLGGVFCCSPPVPYLLCTDWLVEGLLVTLCAQVRPSVTLVCRLVDAYVTSLVYMKYGIAGSVPMAVAAAFGWNLGCVILCSVVDRYHRCEFESKARGGAKDAPLQKED